MAEKNSILKDRLFLLQILFFILAFVIPFLIGYDWNWFWGIFGLFALLTFILGIRNSVIIRSWAVIIIFILMLITMFVFFVGMMGPV
jgi:hypothetical protein